MSSLKVVSTDLPSPTTQLHQWRLFSCDPNRIGCETSLQFKPGKAWERGSESWFAGENWKGDGSPVTVCYVGS
eukprot:scaffold762_cov363-Pavlova_lutheri.AAC.62